MIEIVNGDAVMVKRSKNDTRKIHLASIRPPRLPESRAERPKGSGGFRPLYDIPFMFEAREFLRKKLINQSVHVTVDYIQPANNDFPEKTCATVTIGGINVAEALVAKGYATVVRYEFHHKFEREATSKTMFLRLLGTLPTTISEAATTTTFWPLKTRPSSLPRGCTTRRTCPREGSPTWLET